MKIESFENRLIDEMIKSTYILPRPLKKMIKTAYFSSSGLEKRVFKRIIENISIAEKEKIPVCQDTGIMEIWLKIGNSCRLDRCNFNALFDRAAKKAHKIGGLRKSMDRIRPVLHTELMSGKNIDVVISPRGFGSENYSFLHMMPPVSSIKDITDRIILDVKEAGGRPCPPYVIGIGIGGTASKAVEMSVEALTEAGSVLSTEEERILRAINRLKTGAGSVGGRHTALSVRIKRFPMHIAGLALGVHIGCWCNRVRRFRFETS
ncbi:MAG: fumarate hydratase [Elusimicrobiota bacterium]